MPQRTKQFCPGSRKIPVFYDSLVLSADPVLQTCTCTVEIGYSDLGYNDLGYNDLGYNDLGYNDLGYNDKSGLAILLPKSFSKSFLYIIDRV